MCIRDRYSLRKRDDPNAPILNLYHTHTIHGTHLRDEKDCRITVDPVKFKKRCAKAVVEKMCKDIGQANDNHQIYFATADWSLTRSHFAEAASDSALATRFQIAGGSECDMSILVGSNSTMEEVFSMEMSNNTSHECRVYDITHSPPLITPASGDVSSTARLIAEREMKNRLQRLNAIIWKDHRQQFGGEKVDLSEDLSEDQLMEHDGKWLPDPPADIPASSRDEPEDEKFFEAVAAERRRVAVELEDAPRRRARLRARLEVRVRVRVKG